MCHFKSWTDTFSLFIDYVVGKNELNERIHRYTITAIGNWIKLIYIDRVEL